MQDAEENYCLCLHYMSVHYLSGSHGVPDVSLFQFLSFAWSIIAKV